MLVILFSFQFSAQCALYSTGIIMQTLLVSCLSRVCRVISTVLLGMIPSESVIVIKSSSEIVIVKKSSSESVIVKKSSLENVIVKKSSLENVIVKKSSSESVIVKKIKVK